MAPLFKKKKKEQQAPIPLEVLLMCIPVKNPAVSWEKSEKGEITIKVKLPPSKPGLLSGFVKEPTEKKYVLDEVGSYVWELIDGKRTIGEMAELIAKQFKLHRREAQASLLAYLQLLAQRGLIRLMAPKGKTSG